MSSHILNLIVAFTGSVGNLNYPVAEAVRTVMKETPVVTTISGSAQTKLRVGDITTPFTPESISAIAEQLSKKTGCRYDGTKEVRQAATQQLEFTCPRR